MDDMNNMDDEVKKSKFTKPLLVAGLVVFGLTLLALGYYWQSNTDSSNQNQEAADTQVEDASSSQC